MGVSVTVAIQIYNGSTWDTFADVIAKYGIKANYGIQGTSVRDRVARAGTMTFVLNNSEKNNESKVGYYSPGHANHWSTFDIGAEVRLIITYSGISYYKWRGYIDEIIPTPGIKGIKTVIVNCVDWMDQAARTKLTGIAVQTDKRSDQIFSTILSNITVQPPDSQIGYGIDVYPYALDNAQDEKFSVLSEFQRLANSELGYIYVKGDTTQGGTLVFESRVKRGQKTTALYTLDDDNLTVMPVSYARDDILNRVHIQIYPRKVDAAATSVLFSLENKPQIIRGTTLTFRGPYRDPDQRAVRAGGTDMVAPVVTTDYTANTEQDGSGSDISAFITVTATYGGNSVELEVTNTGALDGYITKLQCRGKGIYSYENVLILAKDDDSIDTHGENIFSFDMYYQSELDVGLDAAYYILNRNKDPYMRIKSAGFVANRSHERMIAALAREISDRISVEESVTGVDSDYFINAVGIDISPGGIIRCTWTLDPADVNNYWKLEIDGYTELGETTVLGYGIFIPNWQLDSSELGVDTIINAA